MKDDRSEYDIYDAAEEERREEQRRRQERESMRKLQQQKRQKRLMQQYGILGGALLVSVIVLVVALANHGKGDEQIDPKQIAQEQQTPGILYDTQEEPTEESTPVWSYEAHTTDQ